MKNSRHNIKTLTLFLSILLITSFIQIPFTCAAAENTTDHLIINQVYGRADKDAAAISHSFIELYNPTGANVDLNTYSVQVAANGNNWQKLDLTDAVIGPNSSFLIRCSSLDGIASRYYITNYDLAWDSCNISNDNFKIALMNNQTLLTITSPGAVNGVVDLVGGVNTGATIDCAEGIPIGDISKQKTARRINFIDTDHNNLDFEVLDYRTSGITNARLAEVRPRYSGDGEWGTTIVPIDQKLVFSHKAGIYQQAFNLELTTGYNNGIIRYTTDGSDPKISSTAYSAPILIYNRTSEPNVLTQYTNIYNSKDGYSYTPPTTNIFKGNVIKAQVFSAAGNTLSDVYTNSYFVNPYYDNLPIVSLVTDKDNLFNNTIGIFIWPNSLERGSDWERPVHVEMFEPDGSTAFSQNMGVRIHGLNIRGCAQKTMRLYAKSGYDSAHPMVEYDIFEGRAKTINGDILASFKRLLLRQSGQDYNKTLIRDALFHDLMHDTNIPVMSYRQSVVFINGEFWGVYNIRERGDDESVKLKYNLDKAENVGLYSFSLDVHEFEDYDESDELQVADWNAYMEMWNWFNTTTSLASAENYAKAQTFMDIDNYIDYIIANTFVDNSDFPGNNMVIWRYRQAPYPQAGAPLSGSDGRWRWYLKDLDWGFGVYYNNANYNPFRRLLDTSHRFEYNAAWSTLIFRKLMTNDAFREKFVNRYSDLLNTNFRADVINAKIDAMAGNISGSMQQHAQRWIRHFSSISVWNNAFSNVRTYANNRANNTWAYFNTYNIGYGSRVTLNLNTDGSKGYIRLNGVDIKPGTDGVTNPSVWSGSYFVTTVQTIKAVPYDGYRFVKFVVNGIEYESDTMQIQISGATNVQAIFEEAPTGVTVAGRVITFNPNNETTIKLLQDDRVAAQTIIEQEPGKGQVEQQFTLENVTPGVYKMVITKKTHLSYTITNLIIGSEDVDLTESADSNISTIILPCGDINGDGFIDSSDLSIIILPENYDRQTNACTSPAADLAGIGWVNSVSLSIVILPANYDKTHIVRPYK